jgi:hypothetical protein
MRVSHQHPLRSIISFFFFFSFSFDFNRKLYLKIKMKLVAIDNLKHLKQFGVSNDVTVKYSVCLTKNKRISFLRASVMGYKTCVRN